MSPLAPRSPLLRSLIVALIAAVGALAAPAARADALVDLVRSVGAAPAVAGKPGARKTLRKRGVAARKRVRRAAKTPRRARPAALELTAAERGSGTVDTLDVSGPVSLDEGPAIEPKAGLLPVPSRR